MSCKTKSTLHFSFVLEVCIICVTVAMEKCLDQCLEDIINVDGVTGCVLTDNQGLCLGVKGKASYESSGIIKAIADQVMKLQPHLKAPTIVLESDFRECLIQHNGNVTAAIYKSF